MTESNESIETESHANLNVQFQFILEQEWSLPGEIMERCIS